MGASKSTRHHYSRLILYAILGVYLVFVLFPITWLVLSSLKTHYQTLIIPPQLVFQPTMEAYEKIFTGGMLKAFANSLKIAGIDIVLALFFGIPAAYSLARFKSKLNENIGFWFLSIRMAPAFGVIVPIYIVIRSLKLLDSIFAVNLAHLLINLPFAIWLLKGYFEEMPIAIEESALIDGATRLQVLLRIVLPPSMPMVISVAILTFMFSWNEFLFVFVLTSSEGATVPVLVASLAGTMTFDWPLMCAVSIGAMVPAFIFVLIVQRFIVRGLTLGAIK
ncbi:MAG: carbohydrate ABC transporter permease [Desulfobacterales bacterium]|nr:MAG: carbohydrate ABC transporter permease [Desulfobacterales bacterium]